MTRIKTPKRFQAKWMPVRVKKTRQNKKPEPRSDLIGTEMALSRRSLQPDRADRAGCSLRCVVLGRACARRRRHQDRFQRRPVRLAIGPVRACGGGRHPGRDGRPEGAGGGGQTFSLVIRDDLRQPPKSIQNMSDLIDNEKVVAVFGPTNSGQRAGVAADPEPEENPGDGVHRFGDRYHQAGERQRRQLHVPRRQRGPHPGRRLASLMRRRARMPRRSAS